MIEKSWTLRQKGVAGLVGLIIAVAFVSYTMGAVLSSTTDTVASTTSTLISVSSIRGNDSTSTVSLTSYVVQTTTNLVTVTDTGPELVLVSGHAASRTAGTFATDIIFTSALNNATTFDIKLDKNGNYQQQVPNHNYYYVDIKYGTSLSNVGAGQCRAGALAAWFGSTVPSFDFVC